MQNTGKYNASLTMTPIVNKSNVTSDSEKRIILEAAHGLGFGAGNCNHAKGSANGKVYYENLEARIMIDKIAGYLKRAGVKYEISNQIAGDSYFNGSFNNSCNPESSNCCGFRQGTIGSYSSVTYDHIDSVGSNKYLFAFELHFNGGGAGYSAVMVKETSGAYQTNGQKIVDAVDSVIGTTNSMVTTDKALVGYTLSTITNMDRTRGIPTYYLETFFMDNQTHLNTYVNKREELARSIAAALAEIAGSTQSVGELNTDGSTSEEEDDGPTGGSTVDFYKVIPSLNVTNDFDCTAVLVNHKTGELNELGKLFQGIFTAMKWGGPVIAIALSIIDYIKVAISADVAANQKKANKRTLKRVAIGLGILFLPYMLEFVFKLFGLYDISNCTIGY